MKHSPLGPSALSRRGACPGSYRLEKDLPETTSADAERGSELHAIIARIIAAQTEEETTAALTVLDTLDGYDRHGVNVCLQAFHSAMSIFGGEKPEALVERRVELGFIHPDVSHGTVDFALVQPFGPGCLIDYKFGMKAVPPASENLQLACYAAGLAVEFDLESVTVAVIAPFIKQQTEHTYSRSDLDVIIERIRAIAAACMATNAPLTPGESQCRYCKAAGTCPALAGVASKVTELAEAQPAALTGNDLARWLEAADLAEMRIGAVRARAYQILSAGGEVPGWHLGEGRKTREWTDEAAAEQTLRELAAAAGKDPDAVMLKELVSPAQAEKLLGASKVVRAKVEALIVSRPGKPRLEKLEAQ